MAIIFHLDLDSFFVAVERILNPELIGKPVIVGGNPTGRGVVAACSYEAREFGLHSAMPIRQAYQLCPKGIYVHGHFEEYERYSDLVRQILSEQTPLIEQASIDEFYMDFSLPGISLFGLLNKSLEIKAQLQNELDLPCSIGIAPNKLLAKICSDFNKPNGMTIVVEGKEREFLDTMPVKFMPGIGPVLQKDLTDKGIKFIGDICRMPVEFFTGRYGKVGLDLWKKAHGEGSTVISNHPAQKSISKETTFQKDVLSTESLEEVLLALVGRVSHKLRDDCLTASTITLKLRYADFVTLNRSKTIAPTQDDFIIYNVAKGLLRNAFKRRIGVRLIGIKLEKFNKPYFQDYLFEPEISKREKLFDAIGRIRMKHGYDAINIGASGKISETNGKISREASS